MEMMLTGDLIDAENAQEGPKPGKDDIIPLNNQARAVLESHIKTKSEYIFPGILTRKRLVS